jgi:hypothetical protein
LWMEAAIAGRDYLGDRNDKGGIVAEPTQNLSDLIYERSMEKARLMDGGSYEYPERLSSVDWIVTGVIFVAALILAVVGIWL